MENRHLFMDCLRRTLEVYQGGTFNRWETMALMATCIDVAMRSNPADHKTGPEVREADAVPKLELRLPLSEEDQIFQELYNEATTFWAAGFGRLRLMK